MKNGLPNFRTLDFKYQGPCSSSRFPASNVCEHFETLRKVTGVLVSLRVIGLLVQAELMSCTHSIIRRGFSGARRLYENVRIEKYVFEEYQEKLHQISEALCFCRGAHEMHLRTGLCVAPGDT